MVAKTLIYLAFDHLNRHHGVLASATPANAEIVMIDSHSMLTARRWHAGRLHFLLSSAAHFREQLRDEGFEVHHLEAETISAGLASFSGRHITATAPSSFGARRALAKAGIDLVPGDFFLTSDAEFTSWAGSQTTLVMENFYRWQRRRLNLLMDGNQPLGGQWNFDAENRLPPPKGAHPWPQPIAHEWDEIDAQIAHDLAPRIDLLGVIAPGLWGTTRAAALRQLEHFLTTGLSNFGPYEDAMPRDSWNAYHSLLSPYLNIGLIHPREVIDAALARFEQGSIPISSMEGFVRQIIGWREYVHGTYWHFGEEYRHRNQLGSTRDLLPVFEDPDSTSMECVGSIVRDVHERAWVHHIPRLMVLSNLALLAGVEPAQYLDWMRRLFIDAADWVMVPNVIGMGIHADGGQMMTKPYAAGGAYIKRMGRYCGSCRFDPGKRTGPDACPFTTLYWEFLARHREQFAGNHRMAQQLAGLDRLSDLPETRERAREVLDLLERGTL